MAKYDARQVAFIHSLKGAPASILIALALTGVSMTNQDLQLITGYTDKPITDGLAMLEIHGLAQHNGRQYGWSLPHGLQLPLFPSALLGRESRSASLGSGSEAVDNPVDNLDDGPTLDRKNSDLSSEKFRSSGGPTYTRARAPGSSSSSSDPLSRTEGEEEEGRRVRKFSDLRDAADNPAIYRLLAEAGVGRRSKAMRRILALELDVDDVRAFVLDRQALGYPVGHLIRKLLDGDPLPPARCPHCKRPLPCYCSVVSR